jgi:glycosyltransferase involved in cell wall biosynthesis
MRIGIDMLGNQSPVSRKRGVGRFVRGLVRNLLLRHPRHDYFLYHHPGPAGPDDAWPGGAMVRMMGPDPADDSLRGTAARLVAENPDRLDVYLLPSALEYYGGFLPPAKPLDGPKLAVVIHDLIPALFQDHYLRGELMWAFHWALHTVRRFDLLLTVSESTRADCLRYLNVPPQRLVTIGEASDGEFFVPNRRRPAADEVAEQLRKLGIAAPFVYYLSGDDLRKNHKGLVAAFALLPLELRRTHQLVITCLSSPVNQRELRDFAQCQGVADRLVLTNFVPDEVTRTLYQQCAAFAFVSRYEGFGLPLLEALHCGAPVLAGRNSSQLEVVGDAGLLANVDDAHDVARQLERLLVDRTLAETLSRRGPEQAAHFRWETTVDRTAEALEGLASEAPSRRSAPAAALVKWRAKPRLAFFSPLPPQPSGVAEYADNLLGTLREYFTIDLYHGPSEAPQLRDGPNQFACRDYRTFGRHHAVLNYDRVLYHMGNSCYHGFVYDTLARHPGVVVLHDLFLANFNDWYAQQPGAPADHFFDELSASAPARAAEYRASGAEWPREPGGLLGACVRRGITCCRNVLERCTAVVVHDIWNMAAIGTYHPEYHGKVYVIPHGAAPLEATPRRRAAARQAFGLPEDALIYGCFGILSHTKCNIETVNAFIQVAAQHPRAVLIFVGHDAANGAIWEHAGSLGLLARVHFLGHVTNEALLDLVATTDVGVNLRRPPTNGETSGTLQLLMAASRPTIVSDVDTFSSYPDHTVCKIAWGEDFTSQLASSMHALAADAQRRDALGAAAGAFIRQTRDWRMVARLYAEAIEDSLKSELESRKSDGKNPVVSSLHAA